MYHTKNLFIGKRLIRYKCRFLFLDPEEVLLIDKTRRRIKFTKLHDMKSMKPMCCSHVFVKISQDMICHKKFRNSQDAATALTRDPLLLLLALDVLSQSAGFNEIQAPYTKLDSTAELYSTNIQNSVCSWCIHLFYRSLSSDSKVFLTKKTEKKSSQVYSSTSHVGTMQGPSVFLQRCKRKSVR